MSRRNVAGLLAVSLPPAVLLGAGVLAWQLVALAKPSWIPTLGEIGSSLSGNWSLLWGDTVVTLWSALAGLGIGAAVAFALAVAMCEARLADRAVMPVAVLVYVTPVVALTPGISLVFGIGVWPKLVVTALVVFFPFLVNVRAGLSAVEPEALEVLDSLAASRAEVLWRLRLPASVPYLASGARICVPLSLVGAVIAGFAAASNGSGGLGLAVFLANENGQLGFEYAAVLCLAVLGIVLSGLVALAERRLMLAWGTRGLFGV